MIAFGIFFEVIEIKKVTKCFGGVRPAVKNLSLTIATGEVFGFLGPNGAGKTTTMKMILGLLRPTKGEITLLGERAGSTNAQKKVGFLPEFAHFYQHLTGREFLHFVGEIFHLSENEIQKRSKKLLKQVCLPAEASDRQIGTYSKGMQQRIGMAQALMNDPDILFLDEPMSGLDPVGRKEMKEVILSLKKEGKTIFFNSHILSDVEEICDRIGIIHMGGLLLHGDVKKVIPRGKVLEDVFLSTLSSSSKKQSPKNQKKTSSAQSSQVSVQKKKSTPVVKKNQKKEEKKKPKASSKKTSAAKKASSKKTATPRQKK